MRPLENQKATFGQVRSNTVIGLQPTVLYLAPENRNKLVRNLRLMILYFSEKSTGFSKLILYMEKSMRGSYTYIKK